MDNSYLSVQMRIIFFFSILFIGFNTVAQLGGRSTYQFLNAISSPKVAALGGYAIAIPDADLEMTYFNPALIDSSHHNRLTLNYVNYFSDINYGYAGYARTFKKLGIITGAIKYINYGKFLLADEQGSINGEFSVSETAFNLGWANDYKYGLRYGVNLKVVYSNFYEVNSLGALLDLGGTWKHEKSKFMAALVVKNLGSQITTYTDGNFETLPFEIQLGLSKRLKHAPFRFSLNFHNLQVPNFWYSSPNKLQTTSLFGADIPEEEESHLVESFFRHVTGGVEVLFSKSFQIRLGYNHQRRSELRLREGSKSGLVGFNFGVGIRIKKFQIDYGRSIYSLAGATNHLSISTNFSELIRKEKKVDEPVLK